MLARHDNVVAVLVGHAHTMATTTFAGVPVLVGGGLVSTVTTDAEDMPRIDYSQPPTIALHLVEDDHLVTHWRGGLTVRLSCFARPLPGPRAVREPPGRRDVARHLDRPVGRAPEPLQPGVHPRPPGSATGPIRPRPDRHAPTGTTAPATIPRARVPRAGRGIPGTGSA